MYRFLLTAVISVIFLGCGQPQKKVSSSETGEVAPINHYVEVDGSQHSVLAEPKVTYGYKLGVMVEKTKTFEKVQYPDGEKTVPVINGYIPMVFVTTYPNGDQFIVYDYRKHVAFQPNKVASK